MNLNVKARKAQNRASLYGLGGERGGRGGDSGYLNLGPGCMVGP